MADRNALVVVKPMWVKQAEEAKLKSEAEKAAAANAKAAFEATFKDLEKNREAAADASDGDSEDGTDLANKPFGPVDPARCMASGAGIAGGTACAPSVLTVVTKDADGSNVPHGGASISVKVSPSVGVGGSEQEGILKDMGDGTYSVTYIVPKRGDYMVTIECNGKAIMGSPFPVFFSADDSQMRFGGKIVYSKTKSEVEEAALGMKQILEDKKREAGTVAIGFDIEWKPSFRKGVLPGKAAVVQICFDHNFCHVMHIIHSGIPPTLLSLLEDPSLLKVGVGIDDDGVKMYKDHKVCLKSLKDLSCLANQKLGGVPRQWGLKSLTEMLLSKKLAKTKKIGCGNWAAYSLSKKQLEYAANDAFASWLLYEVLKGYPDAEDKDVKVQE